MEKVIQNEIQETQEEAHLTLKGHRLFLHEKITKLSFVCDRLNPYEPIPDYLKKELRALGLGDLLDGSYDPFSMTNKLLTLMENALEELELYKNSDA